MMLTTSVIEFRPEGLENIKKELESTESIDICGVEPGRILVIIDSADKDGVDGVCKDLHSRCEDIIAISHHSFYFEEHDSGQMPPVEELVRKKK